MHRLQDAPSSYNKHQVHVMTQLQYTNRLTSSLASKYLTVIYDVMTLFTDWLAYVSGNIWMCDYLQTIYKRIDPKEMSCRQFIQGLSKDLKIYATHVSIIHFWNLSTFYSVSTDLNMSFNSSNYFSELGFFICGKSGRLT